MTDYREAGNIWPDFKADKLPSSNPHSGIKRFRLERADGNYEITEEASFSIKDLTDIERARITTWLVDQRAQGDTIPLTTTEVVEYARKTKSIPVHERADRLLKYLVSISDNIGKVVTVGCEGHRNDFGEWINSSTFPSEERVMARSESVSEEEIRFLIEYLANQGWIEAKFSGRCNECTVMVDGYRRIADQSTNPISDQAFVAMWFDPSIEDAFSTGIEPGIKDAGYVPIRIDRKDDHVNKIDDEIIAEIRRSRFLVADFTHGKEGARGGVYYEAGFARGLGIPVFSTCKKDLEKELHFDTRQFKHILWENHDDLRKRLQEWIMAVIGEGPNI